MHCRFLLAAAFTALPALAGSLSYGVNAGADAVAWKKIFGTMGIASAGKASDASIQIVPGDASVDIQALSANHIVIIEGAGAAAQNIGLKPRPDVVAVRQISDVHSPKMQIIWEQPANAPSMDLPSGFQVFAAEKWKGIPVLAGNQTAHGATLWMATGPGANGFERYPYLLQALVDLGLDLPLQTTNLWAFFDSSYRIRADVNYLAKRWRRSGIGVLHAAAWHNVDPDPVQDEYIKQLIAACHRNAILVYAWLELPHVSEKFWADHPQWREKTALGQDAQLDWRKLMNLQNPECRREVARQTTGLLNRFDWDGVNIAELYFESLEGVSNPARFTPMNDDVRAEFKQIAGFDPSLLFDSNSSYSASKNPAALRKFLDFRAILTSRMQADWLNTVDLIKTAKPYLDVVLTHIDDRFDGGIRDELGADVARSLPIIQERKDTLLVEDPATLWNLGPERYAKLAQKYHELSPDNHDIAVDINVVERYQDVYPTKKQTGLELFELVHQAAESFSHVALYIENLIEKQDLSLLPAAATTARLSERGPDELEITATEQTRVAWQGSVEVDSKLWPVASRNFVLVPAGRHRLSPAVAQPPLTISDFNGEIRSAVASANHVDLSYFSRSRALATVASALDSVEVDGSPFWKAGSEPNQPTFVLPSGQHLVSFSSHLR